MSALLGTVRPGDEHPRESVQTRLTNVRIDAVAVSRGRVVYSGVVHGQGQSRPLTLEVTRIAGRLRVDVGVPGVDAVVLHLDWRPATTGIPPALPNRNLRAHAWWVSPEDLGGSTFTWVLGTDLSLGPGKVERAVDVRPDGRMGLHVWSPRAILTVTDRVS